MSEPDYKSLFESEQKRRLDDFDFLRMYSSVKAKLEIERLEAINAELLAACQDVIETFTEMDSDEHAVLASVKKAIANAQPLGGVK